MIAGTLVNWRMALACVAIALFLGLVAAWRMEAGHRHAAEARILLVESQRADAERRAASNAAAAIALAERHQQEMAALVDIQAAQARRMDTLADDLEALRRDPSYDTPAAPVLELSLDRLRAARAARAGNADRAGDGAGGPVGLPAAPGPAGAGDAADTGPGGGAAAGTGGGAR